MATQITASFQSWTDFLTTAARLYKNPYHEQLMIYAQRPEATACADYELWNKRMGRYVRRGAKGIALIDHSGDAPKLKYQLHRRYSAGCRSGMVYVLCDPAQPALLGFRSHAGRLFGSLIHFNTEGLDFSMTAMFVVIFLEQWLKDRQHTSALLGLGLSALSLLIFGQEHFVIPAMAALLGVLTLLRAPLEKRGASV